MWRELRPAIVVLVALTAITGLIYPLAITGIAELLFPNQAQGSLVERNGRIIGSVLIGQNFTSDKYFHGRPSVTTAPDPNDASKTVTAPYNAANSGGSNLAPSNKAPFPLTSSPRRPAGSIRTFHRKRPFFRFRELPKRAT
jgi:K+-transporting ATPase ATPase C chain